MGVRKSLTGNLVVMIRRVPRVVLPLKTVLLLVRLKSRRTIPLTNLRTPTGCRDCGLMMNRLNGPLLVPAQKMRAFRRPTFLSCLFLINLIPVRFIQLSRVNRLLKNSAGRKKRVRRENTIKPRETFSVSSPCCFLVWVVIVVMTCLFLVSKCLLYCYF